MEDLLGNNDVSAYFSFFFFFFLILLLLLLTSSSYLLLLLRTLIIHCTHSSTSRPLPLPLPPPGGVIGWLRGALGVETLSFLLANNSGRGFYHFVRTRALRCGSCFRTVLFGRTNVFLLSSPAAVSHILAADPPYLSKRYVRTIADLLGDHSLLCTSHGQHRSMRRAVAGLFSSASTAAFAATFDRLTTQHLLLPLLKQKQEVEVVVVLDAALDITFRAICEMLIGAQEEGKLEQLQSDVMDVSQAMLALPLRLPGTRFYRGLQARRRIMDVLRQEISSRRRKTDSQHHDFLQTLLLLKKKKKSSTACSHSQDKEEEEEQQQQQEEEAALTDEEIQDNILTLIIAGQVTTATAITWMVKYLADSTHIQDELRKVQLELHPADQDSSSAPLTLQHLNTMDYAYKAVKESLRMATIVTWFPRVALKDCQLAGFRIKKDWIVNVDARSIHYDPTIYDNPTVFDPSRFNQDQDQDLQGKKKKKKKKQQPPCYSFLAFGAGGRTCLGMNLAKIMMLIFLHRLVTNFRWEMADHDTSLEKWEMFPRLKNGCPIRLTPIHNNNN